MIKNTLGLSPRLFKIHYVFMTCISVLILTAFIPFILKVFGVEFLPNSEPLLRLPTWSHWVIGAALALPLSILLVYIAVVCFSDSKIKEGFIFLFSSITSSFMVGACSHLLLGATVPMLHTIIFGAEGHIEYKMRDSYDRYGRFGCDGGIAVETKVIRHSILCGMKLEANHGLPLGRRGLPKKGATIIVYGRTSRAGVFYTSFEAIPNLEYDLPISE